MRRLKATAAAGIVAGVVALSILIASPAQAAGPGWTPDGFSPKAFMLNVTSSVLAAFGNTAAKRALVANSVKYDHGWETLEAQMKSSAASGVPMTVEDYQLAKQQWYVDNGIKAKPGDLTGKKAPQQLSVPATAAKKLVKTNVSGGVGGGAVLGSAYFGFQFGKGISNILGLDESGICKPNFDDGGLVSMITGTDCSDFLKNPNDYVANADVAAIGPGGDCTDKTSTSAGYGDIYGTSTNTHTTFAAAHTTPLCRSVALYGKKSDGSYIKIGYSVTDSVTANPDGSFTVKAHSEKTGNSAYSVGYLWECVKGGTATWGGSSSSFDWTGSSYKSPAGSFCSGGAMVLLLVGSVPDGKGGQLQGGSTVWSQGKDLTPILTDPDRTLQCSITGTDGKTYTASSPAYKESSGANAEPQCPALPDGVAPANVAVQQTGGPTPQKVYDQPTTPAFQSWYSQYPECIDGACSLDLLDKRQTPPVSCFDSAATATACQDWMKDPQKTTDYQCTYGAHNVDLTECYAYGDVFKPEKIAAGQAYTDPATGESVAGQSSPTAAQSNLGKTITDPSDFTGCLDKGWAEANPVEWVMVPVQCALQWAFAPRESVINDDLDGLTKTWGDTTPAKVVTAIQSWKINPSPGGCTASVPFYNQLNSTWITVPIIQACDGDPMGGVMPWVRGVVTVVAGIGAAFACRRVVAKWVDYS